VKRNRSPRGRLARVGVLGLLAGAIAGAAAAGDIETSYRKGRIASAAAAFSAPPEPEPPPATAKDEFGLADSQGYTLAASLRFAERGDCRTVAAQMRSGCLDYVAKRASGALEPEGSDPF
jgi:hypothetical protein